MKFIARMLTLLLVLSIGAPALAEETFFTFGSPQAPPATMDTVVQDPEWTYPISREILLDPDDVIRLVNKENLLEKSYPDASTLVNATVSKTSSSKMQVREIAHEAMVTMFAAAKDEGIKLYLESAYRAYSTQATIYENRLKKNNGKDDGYVQKPGASEHQTGLGVDILSWAWRDSAMNEKFAQTQEAQWMAANCARFGFIIRYPKDKEEITGIKYEPWHLRYVGVEVATYMTENNLCLEEFTAQYRAALADYDYQLQHPVTLVMDSMTIGD